MTNSRFTSQHLTLTTTSHWLVRFFWPMAFVVALGIAVPTAFGFLAPKWSAIHGTTQGDLEEKRQALTDVRAHLSQIQILEKKLAEMSQEEIRKIEQLLPPESDKAELFTLLESMTHNRGLNIHTISISPSETFARLSTGLEIKNATIGVWDVTLVVSGVQSYELYKQFLSDIERNLRLYDLVSVSYTPGADQQTFNLKTYYKKITP